MLASTAQADPSTDVSFGVMLGLAVPSSAGTSSRFTWGIEGDYELLENITAGGYFLTSSQDNSIPPVSSSQRISLYGLQGRLNFAAIPGLSAGARLGLATFTLDVSGSGSTSSTDLSIGPFANFDYPVLPQLTVGGDLSILFVTASSSYNVINILGTIKYWF
jgi:hypothetical protein